MIAVKEYAEKFTQYYDSAVNLDGIRLGQYLMNELVPSEACPEVFYEENPEDAARIFYEIFVDKS